jgi:hypothetical protein
LQIENGKLKEGEGLPNFQFAIFISQFSINVSTPAKGCCSMSALLTFSGAVEREPAIERWFDAQRSELASIARAWFVQMRQCGPDVRELMHDGCPVVCVEDAPFAYVNAFRAHVNVGFFHGAALADPTGLLEGTGKYMRHVKVRPDVALDASSLEALIAAAYRDILARLKETK